jgi:hypothetical protein
LVVKYQSYQVAHFEFPSLHWFLENCGIRDFMRYFHLAFLASPEIEAIEH